MVSRLDLLKQDESLNSGGEGDFRLKRSNAVLVWRAKKTKEKNLN